MSQPADTVRAAIRTLKDLGDAVHDTVNDAVSSADRDQIAERLRDLPFQAVRLAVAGVGQAIALADKVQNLIEEQAREATGSDTADRHTASRDTASRARAARERAYKDRAGQKRAGAHGETEPARRPEGHARASGRNGSVVAMPQHNGADEAARAQRATARRAERPARSVPKRTTPQPAAPKAETPKTETTKAEASKASAPRRPAAMKASTKSGTTRTTKSSTTKSGTSQRGTTKGGTAGPGAAGDLPVPDYDSASLASVRARLRNLTQADLRKLRSYEKSHAARPEFLTMFDNRLAKLRDAGTS